MVSSDFFLKCFAVKMLSTGFQFYLGYFVLHFFLILLYFTPGHSHTLDNFKHLNGIFSLMISLQFQSFFFVEDSVDIVKFNITLCAV